MTPKKQVSPAIRILRGERDASARATHLEAATRKFLVTTNERKQMSTKTNFKRIALVAIASLGLGVLSSVPAKAVIIGVPTITTVNGTATLQKSDSTTAATLAVKFNATQNVDSVVVTVSLGSKPATATHDSYTVYAGLVDTATSTAGNPTASVALPAVSVATGFLTDTTLASNSLARTQQSQVLVAASAGQAAAKFRYYLDTAVARIAGTYTFDYYTTVYSGSATAASVGVAVPASATFGQFTIVVTDGNAAAAGAVTSSGTSSAWIYQGADFIAGATTDSTSISVVATPDATVDAVIRVTQKTSAGLPAQESVTVTTNIGNLGVGSAQGKSLVIAAAAGGVTDVSVYGDGSGGTATITVKTTSVTFTSKTVVFYGTVVASITATQLLTTIGANSVSTLLAVPKDAAGVVVRSANAVYAFSDALTVINTGATTGTSCGSYDVDYEGYLCSLTGVNNGTANITLRNASTTAAATVASTATAVKVNTNAIAKFTLAFDKATYSPGEKGYVIVKAFDAAGNVTGGGTATNLFASGGITSSMTMGGSSDTTTAVTFALAGTLASAGVASKEAVKLYTVYMPVNGGTLEIKATGGTLLPTANQVAVTAKATVTDSGAAALAAVTALATTVASLKTLITTLTNLVLKIQKKVKA